MWTQGRRSELAAPDGGSEYFQPEACILSDGRRTGTPTITVDRTVAQFTVWAEALNRHPADVQPSLGDDRRGKGGYDTTPILNSQVQVL